MSGGSDRKRVTGSAPPVGEEGSRGPSRLSSSKTPPGLYSQGFFPNGVTTDVFYFVILNSLICLFFECQIISHYSFRKFLFSGVQIIFRLDRPLSMIFPCDRQGIQLKESHILWRIITRTQS